MRIVLVNKFAHLTGGADRHFLDLSEALREAGHEVRLLATTPPGTPAPGRYVAPTVTHESRDRLSRRRQLGVLGAALWNRGAAAAAAALIDSFRPDVIHLHKLYPQLSVAPAVIGARRAPIVQTVHDGEFVELITEPTPSGPPPFRYRALDRVLLAIRRRVHVPRVDRWVLPSEALAGRYAAHGIRGTTIPHFVAADAGAARGYADREGILFVGRLTEDKGVRDVVALAERGNGIPVAVAGSGALADWVSAQAERIDGLSYLGQIGAGEVREAMRRARVLVVPSRLPEAAGLTALEAMASGTPSVAYRSGGLPEYVIDGTTGRLAGDRRDLEQLARELHGDERLWARLSAQCADRAASRHGAGRYVAAIESVYEAASSTWRASRR